jgi:hypothetical protein
MSNCIHASCSSVGAALVDTRWHDRERHLLFSRFAGVLSALLHPAWLHFGYLAGRPGRLVAIAHFYFFGAWIF